MKKVIYLNLSIAGFVLPYTFLIWFLVENGFDFNLIFQQLFLNKMALFFVVDLLISVVVFLIFQYFQVKKHKIKYWWISTIATFIVGLSLALPMFLLLKELQINPIASSSQS